MSSAAVVERQPTIETLGLPNKFVYPEFAGFAGEKHLKKILRQILPMALYRTWEIFVENQAYGNDCYLSVDSLAEKAQRAPKTIRQNLTELAARDLLHLRGERKLFLGPNETPYTRPVVVKDFTGLYGLAHEYAQWCQSGDYIEPKREYVELIKADPRLEAKVRRFDNYRRILYTQLSGPEAELSLEARWFQNYDVAKPADRAEVENTRPLCPKQLPKELPKQFLKGFQNESNEKAYNNHQKRDSFDSDTCLEYGEGIGPNLHACHQNQTSGAQDYMKQVQKNKTGAASSNESKTNPVPPSQKDVPPSAGKTRESAENHPDVQRARGAMATAGVVPGRSARGSAEKELPVPAKHPLARSFVHEVAGLFGDLNEKGSKTGIERSIETFELEPAEVLLCLVRAYVVARDTKEEKIRHRRPETGAANRMPLFCSMFKTFARALASGSPWEYTWQKMLEDIEADDRLSLWLIEHQEALAGEVSDQAATTEASTPAQPVAAPETPVEEESASTEAEVPAPEVPDEGWKKREDAYDWAAYLIQQLAENDYGDLEARLYVQGERYQVVVQDAEGYGYRLVCPADIEEIVARARSRTFTTVPEVSN